MDETTGNCGSCRYFIHQPGRDYGWCGYFSGKRNGYNSKHIGIADETFSTVEGCPKYKEGEPKIGWCVEYNNYTVITYGTKPSEKIGIRNISEKRLNTIRERDKNVRD